MCGLPGVVPSPPTLREAVARMERIGVGSVARSRADIEQARADSANPACDVLHSDCGGLRRTAHHGTGTYTRLATATAWTPPLGQNFRLASQIGLGGVIQTNCLSMLSASL